MTKKITISILTIIIVLTAGFLYLQSRKLKNQDSQLEQITSQIKEEEKQEAPGQPPEQKPTQESAYPAELATSNLDGVLEKIEDEVIYVKLNGQETVKTINLTDKTSYLEMRLSSKMELLGQKTISLSNLKGGDQVSVIVLYSKDKPDFYEAQAVRHMVVE